VAELRDGEILSYQLKLPTSALRHIIRKRWQAVRRKKTVTF
jgi:hypothetical protein